jgi:protein-S-isoprenylcysteine O-methyltransferase Ste14
MTLYAIAAYTFFLAVFLLLIGFVGNLPLPLPWTIDNGPAAPVEAAIPIDLLLVALFGVQHSVMARPAFKAWWTGIVPEPVERSTFVLAASAVLTLTMWQWRPITTPLLWDVAQPVAAIALTVLFWAGWGVLLLSTFLINHFELFGLRQAYAWMVDRPIPKQTFRTPLLYRHVRHPIYLGFLIAFWATPRMTLGHALFAAASTVYILIGIWFEERDLVAHFGNRYRRYRDQVGMLLPSIRKSQS